MGNEPIKESDILIQIEPEIECSNCGTNKLSYHIYKGKLIIFCNSCTPRMKSRYEGKMMICGLFKKGSCNASICNRQKPHLFNYHDCNLLCENMEDSHCVEV